MFVDVLSFWKSAQQVAHFPHLNQRETSGESAASPAEAAVTAVLKSYSNSFPKC